VLILGIHGIVPVGDRVFPLAKLSQGRKRLKKYLILLRGKMPDFVEFQPVPIKLPSQEVYDKYNRFKGARYWDLFTLLTRDANKLGLTNADLRILLHLFGLNKVKFIIAISRGTLAEDLGISYATTCAALKKLIEFQLIRKVKYRQVEGIIVTPDLVNDGTARRRAFKRMLWENKITEPKKVEKPRYYPLTRKKRKTE